MAVIAVSAIPVIGISGGAATAKAKPKPAATPQISITVSPNPAVETGTSNIAVVVQVECNPVHCANTPVTISSTQFKARCASVMFETLFNGTPTTPVTTTTGTITLVADNDGNTDIVVTGVDCAPGTALFTADIDAPPFATGVTKLVMEPPQVTPVGVKGFPANEVEVGDGGTGMGPYGASDVYIVFQVEAPPVYAEQLVTITSDQLTARCGLGFRWELSNGTLAPTTAPGSGTNPVTITLPGPTATTGTVVSEAIDNDGNADFIFKGASCAAGKSTVIADVQAGGPTLSTQYNILPPAVTI
jgi:hypothetical protein